MVKRKRTYDTMAKRRTDNTMTKRRTDNTMTKRRRTEKTMVKRRTYNTMTKRRRTDNTMAKRRTDNSRTVGSAKKFVRKTSGFGGGEFPKTLRKVCTCQKLKFAFLLLEYCKSRECYAVAKMIKKK
jgi:hypothetical protein